MSIEYWVAEGLISSNQRPLSALHLIFTKLGLKIESLDRPFTFVNWLLEPYNLSKNSPIHQGSDLLILVIQGIEYALK